MSNLTSVLNGIIDNIDALANKVRGIRNSATITSFDVYANETEIPVGEHEVLGTISEAIPAGMTERFCIRINSNFRDAKDSDIIIDWGDGTIYNVKEKVTAGDMEGIEIQVDESDFAKENELKMFVSHTYAATGKYTIAITGTKYFGISHQWSSDTNLICNVFGMNHYLASNFANVSCFCINAKRLTKVVIPTKQNFDFIDNWYRVFKDCVNLQYAYGLKTKLLRKNMFNEMFMNCKNLIDTDFVIPTGTFKAGNDGIKNLFNGCEKLTTKLNKLIPLCGFPGARIAVIGLFKNCKSLPADTDKTWQWDQIASALWLDKVKYWDGCYKWSAKEEMPFYGCSDELRAKIPVNWGGTNTQIDVTNANESIEKINSEINKVNAVINDDSLLSQIENQKTLIDNI